MDFNNDLLKLYAYARDNPSYEDDIFEYINRRFNERYPEFIEYVDFVNSNANAYSLFGKHPLIPAETPVELVSVSKNENSVRTDFVFIVSGQKHKASVCDLWFMDRPVFKFCMSGEERKWMI